MRLALLLVRLIPIFLLGGMPALNACGANGSGPSGCCRVCTKGKACGNSCINASKTCHSPGGCACNG